MSKKYLYYFSEGNDAFGGDKVTMKNTLGGKGAGLAEMTAAGMPVPQGFTITTDACTQYYADGRQINDEITADIFEHLKGLEEITGKKFGDNTNPLLVSVRSGARQSMPGMMDTILNLGPGNYGRDYLKESMKQLPFEQAITCSNYVGETLDMAVAKGVKGILFVSHIGKFVKVAAGIMNTHSHQADARMEVLASNAIRAGADLETARKILAGETTDEALEILKDTSWFAQTMKEIAGRIQYYLNHHTYGKLLTGAVIFSNAYGFLAQTESSDQLIEILMQKNNR